MQKVSVTPYRFSQSKTLCYTLGMMIASVSVASCNSSSQVIIDDQLVTSRALVYGQVGGINPPTPGRQVSVVVYPAQCGVGLAFQGEVPLDASGGYRILAETPLPSATRCVMATLLPIIGADTVRNSASVFFDTANPLGAPRDSLRLDLISRAP